jgi:hypothetical protein
MNREAVDGSRGESGFFEVSSSRAPFMTADTGYGIPPRSQGQRQQTASAAATASGSASASAPGPGAVTESGHGHRSPGSATDRGVAGHLVLRCTGLPSRSALVAPPLRLAALRWRGAFVILGRFRPPPGVSTACLVAVARFSERRLPGIATLENVPTRDRGISSTFSRSGTSRRCAPIVRRIARAGAGHRCRSFGPPSPGWRPADARHPFLVLLGVGRRRQARR